MKLMKVFILILICLCNKAWARDISLCENNITSSCSQQIGIENVKEDSCVIYPTRFCKEEKPEPKHFVDFEKDASFSPSFTPYIFKDQGYNISRVAFNISLQTSNSGVTGFYFLISQTQTNTSYESCRKFDFSEARIVNHKDISLYYDCYRRMEIGGSLNFDVIIYALPNTESLHYKLYLPHVDELESKTLCEWSPLKTVNMIAIQRNTIELKFTQAPEEYNVTEYFVQLTSSEGVSFKSTDVRSESQAMMLKANFIDIPIGKYSLDIVPVSSNENFKMCQWEKRIDISVTGSNGYFNHQFVFAIIICGSVIVVVLLGIIMHKLCHKIGPKDSARQELPRPRVLILYSYDCSKHFDVVLKLSEYLKSCCNMDVLMNDGTQQNPITWLPESIAVCQFVVIVISRGVHHKAESKNNPKMKEASAFGDIFLPALNLILNKAVNSSTDNEENTATPGGNHSPSCQVIKVLFEYSSRRHVPSTLFKIGPPCFYLMSQVNEFLCQILDQSCMINCSTIPILQHIFTVPGQCLCCCKIHCQQSKVFPIKIYPKMPGSDFLANTKGKELVKAIEEMRAFQKENPLWFSKTLQSQETDMEDVNFHSATTKPDIEEVGEALADDSKAMIQLNVENNRKPSPSNSGKSVKISLDEEKSPECQVLLKHDRVEDDKV